MTWMMWRQHRAEALALGVLIAAVAAILLLLGQGMHSLFPHGVARCLTPPPLSESCRFGVSRLQQDYGYATPLLILLNFLPAVIGAFLGAPMLARELESGTWQLAWTQSTPRMRWLAFKIVVLAVLSVALTAALSAAVGWFRQPLDVLGGFDITGFDLTGIVPMAYGLFAFALGAAAGTLLRRSLPAAAAALAAFVAVRIVVAGWMRPHFIAPIDHVQAITPGSGHIPDRYGSVRDMILDQGYIDADGRHVTGLAAAIVESKAGLDGADPTVYLHDNGYQQWVRYQPIGRFWTFQLIETGIFVGLAAVLLALVVWRVRRRSF
jgi:ABC-2 family transporter protein